MKLSITLHWTFATAPCPGLAWPGGWWHTTPHRTPPPGRCDHGMQGRDYQTSPPDLLSCHTRHGNTASHDTLLPNHLASQHTLLNVASILVSGSGSVYPVESLYFLQLWLLLSHTFLSSDAVLQLHHRLLCRGRIYTWLPVVIVASTGSLVSHIHSHTWSTTKGSVRALLPCWWCTVVVRAL